MVNRKLQLFLWIGILLLLLFSLFRSVWLTKIAKDEVDRQNQKVESLQQEVEQLNQEVQEATSSYELERRVREELHLQKPDEVIIELPKAL